MPQRSSSPEDPTLEYPSTLQDYQDILTNTPIGVFTSIPSGRFIHVNPALARMYGYDDARQMIEEITDIASQTYVDPADRELFINELLTHGKIVNHECRLRRRDGTTFWAARNARAILDDNGIVTHYQGFTVDISELKRAESALQERVEQHRALLAGLPDVIMRFDKKARHRYVSDSVETVAAIPADGFIGKTHRELGFPEPLCHFWENAINNVFAGGLPQEAEFSFAGPAGEQIFNWRLRPEFAADGTVASVLTIARDITEHRRVEQDYQNLFQKMLDGFALHEIILDADDQPVDYRFLTVNPAFELMTGLRAKDIIGRTVRAVLPETEPFWIETYGAVALTGVPNHFENYSGALDRFFEVTVFRPRPKQFACIFADVSDRKKAERALQESKERLSSIFRAAPIGIGVVSNRVFADVNQRICEMTGYDSDELIGRNARILYPSEADFTFVGDEKYRQIAAHGTGTVETRWRRKDGTIFDILMASTPLDPNDLGKGVTFTALDISERKQTELALQESEQRFRSIVENAPEPIFIQTERRFAYLNPKALALFGATDQAALLGTPVMARFHPDYHERIEQRIRVLNEEQQPISELLEQQFIRLDGSTVWVETSGHPIVFDGKPGGLVFVRDISQRKAAEQERAILQDQLLQSQKMESVGRLAGGIAHDFNNMLGVILGHAELAMERLDPADPLFDLLQEINKAAERSAELTKQLLAFARKQTAAPRVIDLNDTVTGMLQMLRRLIGEHIDLVWIPGGHMPHVKLDPSQIDQILVNLCVNARDAIADTGTVTIRTDAVRIDDDGPHADPPAGDYVLLTVSDDGSGMAPEALDRLFEPFFTTKEIGKGTGLGLATVYGIVKQNDGFVTVTSEPGRGTMFRIYFPPIHPAADTPACRTSDAPKTGGRETILLVEDEPMVLHMTATMLSQQGYQLLTAVTPAAAIKLADTHSGTIDLLITDVVMPEMNGRELARRLKARHPQLKRLFMSGYTADAIAHHGFLEQEFNFIQKPFTRKALIQTIKAVLDRDG